MRVISPRSEIVGGKTCRSCRVSKEIGQFYAAHDSLCKSCTMKRRAEAAADAQADREPAVMRPMKSPYDATCIACARSVFFELTEAQYAATKPRRCEHCGGRMILERSDIGNIGSPQFTIRASNAARWREFA